MSSIAKYETARTTGQSHVKCLYNCRTPHQIRKTRTETLSKLYHSSTRFSHGLHNRSFDPFQSKDCTGSHESLCPSLHRRPDTLRLQRSAERTLNSLAHQVDGNPHRIWTYDAKRRHIPQGQDSGFCEARATLYQLASTKCLQLSRLTLSEI